jgi:lysozyme family protein
MADFNLVYARLKPIEGGYANAAADRGGETYKGVSRTWNPGWEGWKIVDQLRREPGFPKNLDNHAGLAQMVAAFYAANHFDIHRLTELNDQNAAWEVFDISVNMGATVAAEIAQRAINLMNDNQRLWKDVSVDGKIGPATIAALNKAKAFPGMLVAILNVFQGWKYVQICEKDRTQEIWFRGWIAQRVMNKP